ncbi:MAG TPA: helix-turn-helix transcriptional regulator [Streptosporangiaceae bacterium]|jgi:ribosome-binding protein aMBF1 (putative translation factor)
MKLTDLKTHEQAVAEELARDPEFRREWERTALAREVAVAIVAYRTRHKLSQRALAERLGWRPSVVSRLEGAEHNPSIETLVELSRKLGLKMRIEVAPRPGVSVKVTEARAA